MSQQWWQTLKKPAAGEVVDMEEEESVIDLTSDTEAPPSTAPLASAAPMYGLEGVEVISPWALKMAAVGYDFVSRCRMFLGLQTRVLLYT